MAGIFYEIRAAGRQRAHHVRVGGDERFETSKVLQTSDVWSAGPAADWLP